MEITDSEILSIIKERTRKDADLFFIDVCTIGNVHEYEYTKRKQYYGLSLNGKTIVEPIYEKVLCLSKDTVALWLYDKIAIYSIKNNEFISQFDYIKISKDGIYWKLGKESDSISLFNSKRSQFLGDSGYSDYGTKLTNSQYFWAKRGDSMIILKRNWTSY